MPKYRFRAVNTLGQVLKGHMGAANENHLAERLADMGYELLMFRAQQRVHWAQFWSREDNSQQQILLFTQLAALAGAGVPLATCLEDTAVTMPDSRLRGTVRDIVQNLRDGVDGDAAFARHRHTFSQTVVALLQAGMARGNPAQAFAHARDHVQWLAQSGASMRRALRYSLLLLMLTLCVASFMLIGLVPHLIQLLTAHDFVVLQQTRALFWMTTVCRVLWWALPLFLISAVVTVVLLRRWSLAFVVLTDGIWLRLPGIGGLIGMTERAHFLHHLALMGTSGVPIMDALATARTALTNRALQAQAMRMQQDVAGGASLDEALTVQRDFSGLAVRREQIGLPGDDFASLLRETCKELDAGAMTQSKKLIATLESTLTLLVGLLLMWGVLAVLVPFFHSLN